MSGRPTALAQRMELRSRWEAFNRRDDLKPGDLVMEKPGMGFLKPEHTSTHVFMLWRLLDMGDPIDRMICRDWVENHVVDTLDCLVVHISDGGHSLYWQPHSLAQLMRAPDDD